MYRQRRKQMEKHIRQRYTETEDNPKTNPKMKIILKIKHFI